MAFFPRHFYSSNASFTPLLRLLDEFEGCSRQESCYVPQWQPKFDIRETEQSYELHGELPGVNKDDVNIKFAEPQVLTVTGKSARTYTSGTTPVAVEKDTKASDASSEDSSSTYHHATVEDEYETVESEEVAAETEHPDPMEVAPEEPVQQKKPVDSAKYWLSERSIGEFSRSFKFAGRIEHDSITASFKDGILSIVLPKAKQYEARRIVVN